VVEPGGQTLVKTLINQVSGLELSIRVILREHLQTMPGVMLMDNKLILILLAIFLAPIAVFMKNGAGKDLVINIILCILFFFPGMVHALWLVSK